MAVIPILQQEATPEDLKNHINIADWLIRLKYVSICHFERSQQGGVEKS